MQQCRCRWSNCKLNCRNKQNKVFRRKETTKKVQWSINTGFKVTKKGTIDVLNAKRNYEMVNVTFLAVINKEIKWPWGNLECKRKKDTYSWCIRKFKCNKTVQSTYLESSQQQTRYRWCFWMWKFLQKGNNIIIELCQETRKVQVIY